MEREPPEREPPEREPPEREPPEREPPEAEPPESDDFGFDVEFDFPEEEAERPPERRLVRPDSRLAETLGGLTRRPSVLTPVQARRRRTAAAVGAAVLLIVIAVVIAVLAGGDGEGPPPDPALAPPPAEAPPPAAVTGGTGAEELPPAPPAETPTTFADDLVLRPGDEGDAVETLQRALAQLGFDVAADGVYGPGTTAAVQEFQRDRGLTDDGIAGQRTLRALERALAG